MPPFWSSFAGRLQQIRRNLRQGEAAASGGATNAPAQAKSITNWRRPGLSLKLSLICNRELRSDRLLRLIFAAVEGLNKGGVLRRFKGSSPVAAPAVADQASAVTTMRA